MSIFSRPTRLVLGTFFALHVITSAGATTAAATTVSRTRARPSHSPSANYDLFSARHLVHESMINPQLDLGSKQDHRTLHRRNLNSKLPEPRAPAAVPRKYTPRVVRASTTTRQRRKSVRARLSGRRSNVASGHAAQRKSEGKDNILSSKAGKNSIIEGYTMPNNRGRHPWLIPAYHSKS